VDALALGADEGRDEAAKSFGELQVSFDPEISEWGNPPGVMGGIHTEYIGMRRQTRGTETSKYPEEEKEKSIS
jgi:hypothetical protein